SRRTTLLRRLPPVPAAAGVAEAAAACWGWRSWRSCGGGAVDEPAIEGACDRRGGRGGGRVVSPDPGDSAAAAAQDRSGDPAPGRAIPSPIHAGRGSRESVARAVDPFGRRSGRSPPAALRPDRREPPA